MFMREYRLTTVDNPFDPFEQFTSWYMFDMEKGYDCCGKIDRLANYTDDMTENEIEIEKEKAIDTLISLDFLDIFKKVTRKTTNSE